MARIANSRALFLVRDFPIELGRYSGELGKHRFDLSDPTSFFLELKALQANKRLPGLHSKTLHSEQPTKKGDVDPRTQSPRDRRRLAHEGFAFVTVYVRKGKLPGR